MVLDTYRRSLDWWLEPLARALGRTRPDTLTWLSLAAAAGAGVLFWRSGPSPPGILLLMAAWAFVLLNAVLDLLDGKVAKLTGQATPRGDYLDHCVDRFSDAAILLGLSFSPWADARIGLVALAATLLTSYMGTQAQAVGLKRDYSGFLGRADRMVLLLAAPLGQALWTTSGRGELVLWGWRTDFLELVLAYFAAAGTIATLQRFVSGLRGFGRDGMRR